MKCQRKSSSNGRVKTHRFFGIIEEDLGVVWDASFLLCVSASAIDSRSSFGRVSTHETKQRCIRDLDATKQVAKVRTLACQGGER
jgi:hypothetical protein